MNVTAIIWHWYYYYYYLSLCPLSNYLILQYPSHSLAQTFLFYSFSLFLLPSFSLFLCHTLPVTLFSFFTFSRSLCLPFKSLSLFLYVFLSLYSLYESLYISLSLFHPVFLYLTLSLSLCLCMLSIWLYSADAIKW